MERFNKLLLTELRVIEGLSGSKANLEPNFEAALVDKENLNALGYDLNEDGLLKLSRDYAINPDMTPLYKRVLEMEPNIEASPMYPNFPAQVLEMDEVEYRIHQAIHYLTTYGLESLFGVEVNKGWLPETTELIDRVEDEQIVDLKVLDYLSPTLVDERVITGLIGRKERLEARELEIAKYVVLRTRLDIYEVPFKENIGSIFGEILLNGNLQEVYTTFGVLEGIVKHPGDVLDLVEQMVVLNKYKHFKTSIKRGLVNLIEKFPTAAIEENLASNRWSNSFLARGGKPRSSNRNIALIDYLSFNRFSRNNEAKKLVEELKSGLLLSWNQNLEKAYTNEDYDKVRKMLLQRPGIYFRQVNRLIKLGVSHELISADLEKHAGELRLQSIVSALNNFDGDIMVDKVFFDTLYANLASKDIEAVKDKKVFIESEDIDLSLSKLEITDKFAEGGYISNGMAVKIPNNAKFLRFFTYWNDENRIDIDLHGMTINKDEELGHVGWNSRFRDSYFVHSGDITHSDATEYIDIDLEAARKDGIVRAQFNINSYTGDNFSEIETVFTGLAAVGEMREEVDLHNPKNILFRHDLEYNAMSIDYGLIDIVNNVLYVGGKPSKRHNDTNIMELPNNKLTIEIYLKLLLTAQNARITKDRDEADVILGLAKADEDNYISLIDENFFM